VPETLPHINVLNRMPYITHGHCFQHREGRKARCGGPALCPVCELENHIRALMYELDHRCDDGLPTPRLPDDPHIALYDREQEGRE
jgi:hypothetical protein